MNTSQLKRLFLGILTLFLTAGCSRNQPAQELKVKLVLLQTGAIEESSTFIASLQSRCAITLKPSDAGQVKQILVKSGDRVAAGTTIIQLAPIQQTSSAQSWKISAPCSGVISDILVNQGENVDPETPLATITQTHPLEVHLNVPANYAPQLRLGSPVELSNLENQRIGTTTIFFISPDVDPSAQTVLVKSLLDNSKGQLRHGQHIQARLTWSKHPGVMIPTTAVTRVGGQAYVYIAEQKQAQLIARQRPVELGNLQGNNYAVLSGLRPGEKLVTTEVLKLADEMPIVPE